jgi:hypothetical protein
MARSSASAKDCPSIVATAVALNFIMSIDYARVG